MLIHDRLIKKQRLKTKNGYSKNYNNKYVED